MDDCSFRCRENTAIKGFFDGRRSSTLSMTAPALPGLIVARAQPFAQVLRWAAAVGYTRDDGRMSVGQYLLRTA